MLKAGFHRAGLTRYTGFKSSPYTEGALFYGERLAEVRAQEDSRTQAETSLAEPARVECAPGGA
jgi:hypothetical protein